MPSLTFKRMSSAQLWQPYAHAVWLRFRVLAQPPSQRRTFSLSSMHGISPEIFICVHIVHPTPFLTEGSLSPWMMPTNPRKQPVTLDDAYQPSQAACCLGVLPISTLASSMLPWRVADPTLLSRLSLRVLPMPTRLLPPPAEPRSYPSNTLVLHYYHPSTPLLLPYYYPSTNPPLPPAGRASILP